MNRERWVITLGFLVCFILVALSAWNIKLFAITLGGFVLFGLYLYFLRPNIGLMHFVMFLVPMIILSPTIMIPGVIGIRLDDVWLAFGVAVYLSKLAFTHMKFEFKAPGYSKIFIAFICWVAITIFISSYREPMFYNNRDWLEVYKNLKLLLIFIIVAQLKLSKTSVTKIFKITLISLTISALFGIAQYLNFAGVNSWITPYFLAESQIKGFEVHSRIVGTYANPNVFAAALLVGVGLSITRFFQTFKFRFILLSLIFMFTIFLTLSRTALVAGLFLILLIAIQSLGQSKQKIFTILSFIFVPIAALIGLRLAPERFFFRMQNLGNLSQDESFQVRLDVWRDIYETRTLPNLWAGTGPVGNLRFIFDNEWLMLLTTYGIIGIALVVCLFCVIYVKLGKLDAYAYNFNNIALRSIIIVYGLCMFAEPIFQQLQLMPLVVLLISVLLNGSYQELKLKNRRLRITW